MSVCPRHVDPRACLERRAETCWSWWKIMRGLKVSWEEECYGTPDSKSSSGVLHQPHCSLEQKVMAYTNFLGKWSILEKVQAQTGKPMGISRWEIRVGGCWFHQPCALWVVSPGFWTLWLQCSGCQDGGRAAFWNQGSLLVKVPALSECALVFLVCCSWSLWAVDFFFFFFSFWSLLTWHLVSSLMSARPRDRGWWNIMMSQVIWDIRVHCFSCIWVCSLEVIYLK